MAALLTGCDRRTPDIPSFSFQTDNVVDFTSSSDSAHSSASSANPDSTESITSEIPQSSETDEPSAVREYILSHDPINLKTIEINGKTATVSGRTADVGIDHMSVSLKCVKCELTLTDVGFAAKIELTEPYEGYMRVTFVYKDERSDEIVLEVTPSGFALCELPEIVQCNRSVTENALEQPRKQVAEYIAKGGDPEEVREVLGEVRALSDEICMGLDDDYDKLRAISRWVSANIYYDYPAYDKGVPEETLTLKYMLDGHSSVCGGYSNMTAALCAAQGIKCWNVHGSVLVNGRTFVNCTDSEYHEWNFAEIDGRIIWVDSGWNSFCYLRSNGKYDNGGIYYRYFDIGEEYLALNHKANYAEYRDYFALAE